MVLMSLCTGWDRDPDVDNGFVDTVQEGDSR